MHLSQDACLYLGSYLQFCEKPLLEDTTTNQHHMKNAEKRAREGDYPAIEQQQPHKIADANAYAGGELVGRRFKRWPKAVIWQWSDGCCARRPMSMQLLGVVGVRLYCKWRRKAVIWDWWGEFFRRKPTLMF